MISGLLDFANSGLGRAAIGAGVGALGAQAMGEDASKGAWGGGALGAASYGLQGGGFDSGLYDGSQGGIGNSTGLFGSAQQKQLDPYALPEVGGSIDKAITQTPQQNQNFFSNMNLENTKDITGGLMDLSTAYGTYQSGEAERKNAQNEIDYRNKLAALQERNYNRDYTNQAATQTNVADAFNQSSLNYYNA